MDTFTRDELIILHTQVNCRIGRMRDEKACTHPDPYIRASNNAYMAQLNNLALKLDRMIDKA